VIRLVSPLAIIGLFTLNAVTAASDNAMFMDFFIMAFVFYVLVAVLRRLVEQLTHYFRY